MCVQAVHTTIHKVWVQRPVSALHRTSVSRKDTFLTLFATTSFPSWPTQRHNAIFEDTQGSRMAAVGLIIAWRKMVNKGHGMAHADWASLVKNVWQSSVTLVPWHYLYVRPCFLCCFLTVCTYLYYQNIACGTTFSFKLLQVETCI